MQQISIPTMKAMIKHVGIAKRRPLYFHGPSGIGKSEGIFQSCIENDGTMLDIRVSQYESIDFRGIPDVQAGTTVWNMPATMPFKGNPKFALADLTKPIFLFLDEVNQGDPSVLSVLYQLINDRRIGEHELMDNVVIICAGNRDTDRGVTNKFPAPLSNRMTHAELVPDVKAWSAWASKQWPNPKGATLIGFMNFRNELLHTFEPNKPVAVFATPRTWSFAYEDFADDTLPADVKQASIAGSVGEGPATELGAFVEIMNSIKPIEEIIADPEGVPIESGLDIQWAMATHVAGNMDKDNADQLHKFLVRLEPEMVVMAWTMAVQRDEDITDTNAFLFGYAPKFRGLFND